MPEFKYRAFLSYSHADRRWDKWLYRRLEHYKVDESLVGQKTQFGRVPNRLRPIFRDRENLSAGPSLNRQIEDALRNSATLIVICSPSAARSRYVAEEIRFFKKQGRGDRIFAFIVGGQPNDPEYECFPETLKFAFGPDGLPAGKSEVPIAADAQKHSDGRELAFSKLLSGILGVPLERIWRREQRYQRRRMAMLAGTSAIMMLLAAGAGAFGYLAHNERVRSDKLILATLERTAGLVQETVRLTKKYGIPTHVSFSLLSEAEATFARVKEISGERSELQLKRALLNLSFSKLYGTLGKTTEQFRTAQQSFDILKQLATGIKDDAKAGIFDFLLKPMGRPQSKLLPRVHKLQKQAHRALATAYNMKGNFEQALKHYQDGLNISYYAGERAPIRGDDYIINVQFLLDIAELLRREKRYFDAQETTKQAMERIKALKDDVRSPEGKRALAQALVQAANLRRTITDILFRGHTEPTHYAEAAADIRDGLQIAQALFREQKKSVEIQQLLAEAYMVRGDIRLRQKDRSFALEDYLKEQEILQRLHDNDPYNALIKNLLAYSYMKIGETQRFSDDPRELKKSVVSYRNAIDIFGELRNLPDFLPARRNIWLAHWGMELPLRKLGEKDELIRTMQSKVKFAKQEFERRPPSPHGRGDLTRSRLDLGEFLLSLGKLEEASEEFDAVLGLTKDHAMKDTDLYLLQRFRSRAYYGRGRIQIEQRRPAAALEAFAQAERLARGLWQSRKNNPRLNHDLGEILWRSSAAYSINGRSSAGLKTCRQARSHMMRALRIRKARSDWAKQLADLEADCAKLKQAHAF